MKEIKPLSKEKIDMKIDTNIDLYTYCMTSKSNCSLPHIELIKGFDIKDLDKNFALVKYLQHQEIVEKLQARIKELEAERDKAFENGKQVFEQLKNEEKRRQELESQSHINEIKAQGIEEVIK